MAETKKRPKTAVLAFVQDLDMLVEGGQLSSGAPAAPAVKTPPLSAKTLDSFQETQLYTLPSGKKSRFIPKTVPSEKCRVWPGNARDQEKLDNEALEELKAIIAVQGQQVPVLARPVNPIGGEGVTHEVIYGSRRLRVCQQLGLEVKIIEADVSEEDALLLMEAENSGRQDISLYEKSKAYHRWIEEKRFDSYADLAQKLGKSRRWVNKIISFLRLPEFLIMGIPDLNKLTRLKAEKLVKLLDSADAEKRMQLIINDLKKQKEDYTSDELFKRLFSDLKKNPDECSDSIGRREINASDGEKIITIKTLRSGKIQIDINKNLSPQRLAKFLDSLEKAVRKV